MNDLIDTSSDLRDQITIDYREVMTDEERDEQRLRWDESMTMEDILEG